MSEQRMGMAFLDRPSPQEQLKLVVQLEELGYESAWITETRLARDAFTILGAFAAATSRITLGTGVVNTWTRGPALMAVTFATLHEMAPGRIVAGLGAYWDPLAWKQGIDRRKPMSQAREYIGVMRRLFALEEGVTHETDLLNVRDISLDLGHGVAREPIDVPIYLGPTGPKMMEMGGELADGVLINGLLSTGYTRSAVEHIATGAARAGRSLDDVDHPQFVNVAMGDDAA
ncbi:MAG: LLM class flavin-dependent oxidoreductase, partial [Acidimicrobiia bacterium]|nr:LLM class flavin-dependent oxidoreductase [Acidimicrobiia bacterium]